MFTNNNPSAIPHRFNYKTTGPLHCGKAAKNKMPLGKRLLFSSGLWHLAKQQSDPHLLDFHASSHPAFSLAMQDWSITPRYPQSPSLVKYPPPPPHLAIFITNPISLFLLHQMEKKESTTSSHVGICEQLFHAFNPASRPHHRLTHHHQGPRASPNPSPLKETSPQKALPSTPVKPKPSEAIAPKAEPKPTTTPPPPTISVPIQKVPDKLELASAPPKAAKIPQPAPPKAAATPQPLPQPAPPQGAAAEAAATEKTKKNINERVEDYIKRTKERLRSVSGIGRTPTLKMKD